MSCSQLVVFSLYCGVIWWKNDMQIDKWMKWHKVKKQLLRSLGICRVITDGSVLSWKVWGQTFVADLVTVSCCYHHGHDVDLHCNLGTKKEANKADIRLCSIDRQWEKNICSDYYLVIWLFGTMLASKMTVFTALLSGEFELLLR